jgi:hypothetical protein
MTNNAWFLHGSQQLCRSAIHVVQDWRNDWCANWTEPRFNATSRKCRMRASAQASRRPSRRNDLVAAVLRHANNSRMNAAALDMLERSAAVTEHDL